MYLYITNQSREYHMDEPKALYKGWKPLYLRAIVGGDGWEEQINNTTDNLMPDIIGDQLHKLALIGLFKQWGVESFRFHTERLWMNTERRKITVTAIWSSSMYARWEVIEPVFQLFRWAVPSLNKHIPLKEELEKGVKKLSAEGLETFKKTLLNGMSRVRGQLVAPQKLRMFIGRTSYSQMAITELDPCILLNVSPKWGPPYDKFGFPIKVEVTMTFEEVWTPHKDIWGGDSKHVSNAAASGSITGSMSPYLRGLGSRAMGEAMSVVNL